MLPNSRKWWTLSISAIPSAMTVTLPPWDVAISSSMGASRSSSVSATDSSNPHHILLKAVASWSRMRRTPMAHRIALKKLVCLGSSTSSFCKLCCRLAYAQTHMKDLSGESRRTSTCLATHATKSLMASPHQWLANQLGTCGVPDSSSMKAQSFSLVAGSIAQVLKWYRLSLSSGTCFPENFDTEGGAVSYHELLVARMKLTIRCNCSREIPR
mmetsp:Transcript_57179/g.114603  ORF Transcript_57179/g.114603 Transcript_57179/m.114603 type:complete len:213 (+) Transcript_57179:1548-2186(+)